MEIKNFLIKRIEFYRSNVYPNLQKSPGFIGDMDFFMKSFSSLKSFKWLKISPKFANLVYYVYADKFIEKYKNKLLGELLIEPVTIVNFNSILLFQINTKLFAGMMVNITEDSKSEYVPVGSVFCLFNDYADFISFYDDALKMAYFPNDNSMGFLNAGDSSNKIISDLLSKFNTNENNCSKNENSCSNIVGEI